MNLFYKLFGDDPTLPISQRFEQRQRILGISKDAAIQKVMMGIFDNAISTYRTDQKDPTACAQLEFFAGSISAQTFRENLQGFLKTEPAKKGLTPQTRDQISAFIRSSENGAEQAQCIDLIRSQDLRNIELAKTGNIFWTSLKGTDPINASKDEIKQLNQLTLDKVASLNPGEIVSFLGGTLTHETQIAVHHLPSGGWEIINCNTTTSDSVNIYSVTKDEATNPEFWMKIYNHKIGAVEKDLFKDKSPSNEIKAVAAKISAQSHNTCHTQCQMALLKAFIVYLSPLSVEEASLDWKQLKVLFGGYLLEKNTLDDNKELAAICKIGHEKNIGIFAEANFFHTYIINGEYKEVCDAYHDLFEKCGLRWQQPGLDISHKSLSQIQKSLFSELRGLYLTLDQFNTVIGKDLHPCVQYSLDLFINRYLKEQSANEKLLNAELAYASLPPHDISKVYSALKEYITDPTGKKAALDAESDEILKGIIQKGKAVVSNRKQLESHLALLEENPEYLANLRKKPQFTALLVQGIQAGCLKEVEAILSKLKPVDVNWFFEIAMSQVKLYLKFFPQSVVNYLLKNPESLFCTHQGDMIMLENGLKMMLRDFKVSEVLEIYDKSPLHNQVYFKNNFQEKLTEMLYNFSSQDLQKIESEVFALPQHPMKDLLKNSLAHSLYKNGEFEKLFPYDGIKLNKYAPSFNFKADPSKYEEACIFVKKYPDHSMTKQVYQSIFYYYGDLFQNSDEGISEVLEKSIQFYQNIPDSKEGEIYGIKDEFLQVIYSRFDFLDPEKIKKFELEVFKTTPEHPISMQIRDALAYANYKNGDIEKLVSYQGATINYSSLRSLSPVYRQQPHAYEQAVRLIENFPTHSMAQTIFNGIFMYAVEECNYAVEENNQEILSKTISLVKDKPIKFPDRLGEMRRVESAFIVDCLLKTEGDRSYLNEFVEYLIQYLTLGTEEELGLKLQKEWHSRAASSDETR